MSILVRIGVSFISSDQACANAASEVPDFDFSGTRTAAFNEWNELLGRIKVDTNGVKDDIVSLFYSSLYRTHISPADCTLMLRCIWSWLITFYSRHGRKS